VGAADALAMLGGRDLQGDDLIGSEQLPEGGPVEGRFLGVEVRE
jgi:hypothetical protein